MLVTTLTQGDYILIGDNIRVNFDAKMSKDVLAIAIEAPKNLTILRKKLYEQIDQSATKPTTTNDTTPSRLMVTLSKDDYVMIGDDIKVQYKRNNGKGAFAIGISAPRHMSIQRKNTEVLIAN